MPLEVTLYPLSYPHLNISYISKLLLHLLRLLFYIIVLESHSAAYPKSYDPKIPSLRHGSKWIWYDGFTSEYVESVTLITLLAINLLYIITRNINNNRVASAIRVLVFRI